MKLDNKTTKDMLLAIATMFQEKRNELSRLDSLVGDGDHGISMARGAKAGYNKLIAMSDNENINEYFKVYGRSLVEVIGGAIGPLFGSIFTEFGKCVKGLDEITAESFVKWTENSTQNIMDFGGARLNDKTIVDAMIPTAEAARAAYENGKTLEEILLVAKNASKAGVEATIPLMSKRGRSKFLQEKSIGHQDAGATSYYYLINRIHDYYNGLTKYTPMESADSESKKENSNQKRPFISKFINDPENVVEETVNGYAKAYHTKLKKLPNANVLARKNQTPGKVGVVIGNGSGHEPACVGFVGENMLDANAYGGVFAAPGPHTILEAIKEADSGNGVCVLISAHAGDILNTKMAVDMAEDDGILVKSVLLYDDVASASTDAPIQERRGSIGTMFSYKMVGSYSSEGHGLDKVVSFAQKVRDNTRSIAAAMTSGTSPITGMTMFESEPGEVLVGLGVHGESALLTYKNQTCKEIAVGMIETLVNDKPYKQGDEVAVFVNSAGSTSTMELMIFYSAVEEYLTDKGIRVCNPLIGRYITTQEMGGIGLAICKMDAEMKRNWTKETDAPHFSGV